jgi:hypothetical protein
MQFDSHADIREKEKRTGKIARKLLWQQKKTIK